MLLWTRSLCSDKYVVLKEIQHSSVSQNQMELHRGVPEYVSDTWEEVLLEVAASSVSAQFNRCASEVKGKSFWTLLHLSHLRDQLTCH